MLDNERPALREKYRIVAIGSGAGRRFYVVPTLAKYMEKAAPATPNAEAPVQAAPRGAEAAPVASSGVVQVSPPAPGRTAREDRMAELDAEDAAAKESRAATIKRLTDKGIKPTREVVGQTRKPAAEGGGYAPKYQWQLKDSDGTYLELDGF